MNQTYLLNSQFQSLFFFHQTDLDLAKLCHSKLLSGTASMRDLLPKSISCKYLSMPDIGISPAGVAKLLTNLNVSKAAGPDSISPIIMKELNQVIAPVVTLIQTSLDSGVVPPD